MEQILTLKRFKIIFLILFLSYSISPNYSTNSIAQEDETEVAIGIGDVCSISWNLTINLVHYNSTNNIYYIRDPNGASGSYIPNNLVDKYPSIKIIWFDDEVIGKTVEEPLTIFRSGQWSSDNLNPIDPAWGQDIIIDAKVETLYHDSSEDKTTLFDIPFLDEIIVIAIIVAILAVSYKGLSFLHSKNYFLAGRRCISCGLSSKSVGTCGKCNSRICRDCFEKSGKCPQCKANIFHPHK